MVADPGTTSKIAAVRAATADRRGPYGEAELREAISIAGAASYESLFGKQPKVDKWIFSTNAVTIAGRYGIPCLGLGPGDETLAHAPNEACPIDRKDNG